jgi:hypothetical protein
MISQKPFVTWTQKPFITWALPAFWGRIEKYHLDHALSPRLVMSNLFFVWNRSH